MPLMKYKFELKAGWTNHCVFAAGGIENKGADSNNIIFTIKDTKFYVPSVTLSAKDNQKLSKLFSKRFGRSIY